MGEVQKQVCESVRTPAIPLRSGITPVRRNKISQGAAMGGGAASQAKGSLPPAPHCEDPSGWAEVGFATLVCCLGPMWPLLLSQPLSERKLGGSASAPLHQGVISLLASGQHSFSSSAHVRVRGRLRAWGGAHNFKSCQGCGSQGAHLCPSLSVNIVGAFTPLHGPQT